MASSFRDRSIKRKLTAPMVEKENSQTCFGDGPLREARLSNREADHWGCVEPKDRRKLFYPNTFGKFLGWQMETGCKGEGMGNDSPVEKMQG